MYRVNSLDYGDIVFTIVCLAIVAILYFVMN